MLSVPSRAKFYTWIDGEGRKRVSDIPPLGVRNDGTIVEDHYPFSAAAQHRRLRDRLRRQADRLTQKVAIESGGPRPNVPSEVLNGD